MESVTARLLSRSYRWARFAVLPVSALIYFQLIADTFYSANPINGKVWLLLVPLGGWALYSWLDNSFDTTYTTEFLFFNKKAGIEQIPLTQIYQIKYVLFKTYSRHQWNISYYDPQGRKQVEKILPLSSRSMDDFIATVRRQNPQVVVRHWYLFFDQ